MESMTVTLNMGDGGKLTVVENLQEYGKIHKELKRAVSRGRKYLMQTSLPSLEPFVMMDLALSYLSQAMGARSRLQFWMERNEYAIILPTSTLSGSLSVGGDDWREMAINTAIASAALSMFDKIVGQIADMDSESDLTEY